MGVAHWPTPEEERRARELDRLLARLGIKSKTRATAKREEPQLVRRERTGAVLRVR